MPKHLTADTATRGTANARAERFREIVSQDVKAAWPYLFRTEPLIIPISLIQYYLSENRERHYEGRSIGSALFYGQFKRHKTRLVFTGPEKGQTAVWTNTHYRYYQKHPKLKNPERLSISEIREMLLTPEILDTFTPYAQQYIKTHFTPRRSSHDSKHKLCSSKAP